jgi:hypothetical protein
MRGGQANTQISMMDWHQHRLLRASHVQVKEFDSRSSTTIITSPRHRCGTSYRLRGTGNPCGIGTRARAPPTRGYLVGQSRRISRRGTIARN